MNTSGTDFDFDATYPSNALYETLIAAFRSEQSAPSPAASRCSPTWAANRSALVLIEQLPACTRSISPAQARDHQDQDHRGSIAIRARQRLRRMSNLSGVHLEASLHSPSPLASLPLHPWRQRISASRHTAACRCSRAELWSTVSARLIWNSAIPIHAVLGAPSIHSSRHCQPWRPVLPSKMRRWIG